MPSLYIKSTDISKPFLVTIDGGSGVGKSSFAQKLAKHFNLYYFQTSLLYRRLAAYLLEINVDISSEITLQLRALPLNDVLASNERDIYTEEVSKAASIIAAYPAVRSALLQYQIDIKAKYPRLILEGRDTGSVIAPEADLKIFISADLETRAERRYNQLRESGKEAILSAVQAQLSERDARDMGRATAPLVRPEGALELDNSHVTLDELLQRVEDYIKNSA